MCCVNKRLGSRLKLWKSKRARVRYFSGVSAIVGLNEGRRLKICVIKKTAG